MSRYTGKRVKNLICYWLPVLIYMALIFYLSSGPGKLPDYKIPHLDKLGHIVLYGILGLLVFRAFRAGNPSRPAQRAVIFTLVVCVLYGLSDELHQSFVPQRQVELLDIVCDGLGALLVSWIFFIRI